MGSNTARWYLFAHSRTVQVKSKWSKWCSHQGSYIQWADVSGDGKADMICDDTHGRHWDQLSYGNGRFYNMGMVMSGWCMHTGATTSWADVNGDGKADMICDDTHGRHWFILTKPTHR